MTQEDLNPIASIRRRAPIARKPASGRLPMSVCAVSVCVLCLCCVDLMPRRQRTPSSILLQPSTTHHHHRRAHHTAPSLLAPPPFTQPSTSPLTTQHNDQRPEPTPKLLQRWSLPSNTRGSTSPFPHPKYFAKWPPAPPPASLPPSWASMASSTTTFPPPSPPGSSSVWPPPAKNCVIPPVP